MLNWLAFNICNVFLFLNVFKISYPHNVCALADQCSLDCFLRCIQCFEDHEFQRISLGFSKGLTFVLDRDYRNAKRTCPTFCVIQFHEDLIPMYDEFGLCYYRIIYMVGYTSRSCIMDNIRVFGLHISGVA